MSKKSIFDLTQHSSIDLDRLGMAVQSGINEASRLNLPEVVETLYAYRMTVQMAYNIAVERESDEFASKTAKEINEAVKIS
jgi:hypothetical protein